MMATKVGSLKCRNIQLDGSRLDVTLHEVKYVPDLWVNLFSISKELKNGFRLNNKDVMVYETKGSVLLAMIELLSLWMDSFQGSKQMECGIFHAQREASYCQISQTYSLTLTLFRLICCSTKCDHSALC